MNHPFHKSESYVPDFAIFQDDKRMVSGVWIKDSGKWTRLAESDFHAVSIMADMLRNSPDPKTTLRHIAQSIMEMNDNGESVDPPERNEE